MKAYALLAATMERLGKAGIATFVLRAREHLVALLKVVPKDTEALRRLASLAAAGVSAAAAKPIVPVKPGRALWPLGVAGATGGVTS